MIDLKTALREHFFQVPIAERVAQVPGNCLYNQSCLEMPAFEIIFRLALQLLGNGIQNHGSLRNFRSGKFHACGQHTVKPENLRQAPVNPLLFSLISFVDFAIQSAHYSIASLNQPSLTVTVTLEITNSKLFSILSLTIASVGKTEFMDNIISYLKHCLNFDNVIVVLFNGTSVPDVLFKKTWGDAVFKYLESHYLAGAYLLDPIYHFHLNSGKTGLYRLIDIAPDQFRRSHYFEWYYGRIGIADEISVVIPLDEMRTLTISMGIEGATSFSTTAESKVRQHEGVIIALLALHWRNYPRSPIRNDETFSVPDRLIPLMFYQRGIKLSRRQAEIALFILQGHSSLSIGLNLGISTHTVKVFRKQLYRKCNISSQGELFALLMPLLQVQPSLA